MSQVTVSAPGWAAGAKRSTWTEATLCGGRKRRARDWESISSNSPLSCLKASLSWRTKLASKGWFRMSTELRNMGDEPTGGS